MELMVIGVALLLAALVGWNVWRSNQRTAKPVLAFLKAELHIRYGLRREQRSRNHGHDFMKLAEAYRRDAEDICHRALESACRRANMSRETFLLTQYGNDPSLALLSETSAIFRKPLDRQAVPLVNLFGQVGSPATDAAPPILTTQMDSEDVLVEVQMQLLAGTSREVLTSALVAGRYPQKTAELLVESFTLSVLGQKAPSHEAEGHIEATVAARGRNTNADQGAAPEALGQPLMLPTRQTPGEAGNDDLKKATLKTSLMSRHLDVVVAGLAEIAEMARGFDPGALSILDTAIRQRAGDPTCNLYEASVRVRTGQELADAEPKVRDLAARQALLVDPTHTGDLIAALATLRDQEELYTFAREIEQIGGPDQAIAFHLLFARLRLHAQLVRSPEHRGPRTPAMRRIDYSESELQELSCFQVNLPKGDGRCSDNACPCSAPGTAIAQGSGYLYVSPQCEDFRADARSDEQLRKKVAALEQDPGDVKFMFDTCPHFFRAILVCEVGARARGLDLAVAAEDAKIAWSLGRAPLRATPTL